MRLVVCEAKYRVHRRRSPSRLSNLCWVNQWDIHCYPSGNVVVIFVDMIDTEDPFSSVETHAGSLVTKGE